MPILETSVICDGTGGHGRSHASHMQGLNDEESGHASHLRHVAANSGGGVVFCAGCRDGIFDQYFLSVSEEAWHCHCLKCSVCAVILDSQMICYYKDGMILCKDDYYKRYQKVRCKCGYPIRPDEFVMRLRGEFVFHVGCFRCCACSTTLQTGDCVGMRDDGSVYCQRHFQATADAPTSYPGVTHDQSAAASPGRRAVQELMHHHEQRSAAESPLPAQFSAVNRQVPAPFFLPLRTEEAVPLTGQKNSSPKNRSRRRKSLQSFDEINQQQDIIRQPPLAMEQCYMPDISPVQTTAAQSGQAIFTSSSEEESSPSRLTSSSPGMQMAHLSHSHTDSSSPTNQQHQRTKRMRTSFKHQQLRSMKQYFSINHNPDAKDLKQLAQKTGLTKRVLQVWFQNARAKYRRSLLKQDPNRAMEASPISNHKASSPSPRRSDTASPPGGGSAGGGWTLDNTSSVKNETSGHYPMSTGSNSQDAANESYY